MRVNMGRISAIWCKVNVSQFGFPPEFLKEYNYDRSWDFMTAMHYLAATENENNGISEHEDGNLITFLFQDEIGGLQVRKNGEWILVTPDLGTIIVNISRRC
jgi:isopenicillin N synthase-like dioxygenase